MPFCCRCGLELTEKTKGERPVFFFPDLDLAGPPAVAAVGVPAAAAAAVVDVPDLPLVELPLEGLGEKRFLMLPFKEQKVMVVDVPPTGSSVLF